MGNSPRFNHRKYQAGEIIMIHPDPTEPSEAKGPILGGGKRFIPIFPTHFQSRLCTTQARQRHFQSNSSSMLHCRGPRPTNGSCADGRLLVDQGSFPNPRLSTSKYVLTSLRISTLFFWLRGSAGTKGTYLMGIPVLDPKQLRPCWPSSRHGT